MSSKPQITIQDFQRLDLKVGTVLQAEPVEGSKKLYKIKVRLGDLECRTVAGLALYYRAEELIGKRVVFLANLKPTKLAGEVSEGMLLAAESGGKVSLLTPDRDMPDGAHVL